MKKNGAPAAGLVDIRTVKGECITSPWTGEVGDRLTSKSRGKSKRGEEERN